jgi:hypothetical protein
MVQRICQEEYNILVQTGKNSIQHVQTCPIEFILFVPIPGLFYVYSGLNPGLNRLDQFWQSPNVGGLNFRPILGVNHLSKNYS